MRPNGSVTVVRRERCVCVRFMGVAEVGGRVFSRIVSSLETSKRRCAKRLPICNTRVGRLEPHCFPANNTSGNMRVVLQRQTDRVKTKPR